MSYQPEKPTYSEDKMIGTELFGLTQESVTAITQAYIDHLRQEPKHLKKPG